MFMPACIHSAVKTIGGRGGASPQIFADQLTLSQPGGQVMPATLLLAPPPPPTALHTQWGNLHHF